MLVIVIVMKYHKFNYSRVGLALPSATGFFLILLVE